LRIIKALLAGRAGPLRATAVAFIVCSNRHVRGIQIPRLTIPKVG
jgi:hypothetical protein